MGKFVDLTGRRFGMLTVIQRGNDFVLPSGKKEVGWICQCDCGNIKTINGNNLRSKSIKSCGCIVGKQPKKHEDLTGKVFGRLTVICEDGRSNRNNVMWLCKCECGNIKRASTSSLNNGSLNSCGCLKKEIYSSGGTRKTHGKAHTRIYNIWSNMKGRCYNENSEDYKDYGGRGIRVCQEWLDDFMNFYNWAMASGYANNLTIDRIDVNGDYRPENCRWITNEEQQTNKTTTRYIEFNGKRQSLAEWSRELNIPYHTISQRINRLNWSIEKSLTTPVRDCGRNN